MLEDNGQRNEKDTPAWKLDLENGYIIQLDSSGQNNTSTAFYCGKTQ